MMMKTLHILLPLAIAALPTLSPASGVANAAGVMPSDSIKNTGVIKDSVATDTTVHTLKEFEVKGTTVTYRPGEIAYVPTRKQRNASSDAISLLSRMHIPQLRETPGGISSSTGLPIRYFINGHPAADEDLTSMNMSDVRKVLCIDNPSDAKYLGEPYVVDFIVQEYEYGGYSKLQGSTTQLSTSSYTERLTSKWTYRRMTYDLCVAPSQQRVRWDARHSEDAYLLPQGEVTRDVEPGYYSRHSTGTPVQLRAAYSYGQTYVSNRLGYAFRNSGRNISEGREIFSGTGDKTVEYTTRSPGNSHSVNWDGFVRTSPRKGWNLGVEYNLYYTHYTTHYTHVTSMPLDIDRTVREDALSAKIALKTTHRIAANRNIYATLEGDWHHSQARYSGDLNTSSKFDWPYAAARVGYNMKTRRMSADIYAGVCHEHSEIDGRSVNTTYPFGMVKLNLYPTQAHYVSAWAQYSTFSPTLSNKNPNMVRESELMYYAGNPGLTAYPAFTAGLTYTWTVRNNLFINMGANLAHLIDRFNRVFTLTEDEDAMLRSYANTGNCTRLRVSPSATLALFNRSLWINLVPTLNMENPGKRSSFNRIVKLKGYAAATLLAGQFNVAVKYWTPSTQFSNQEMDALQKTRHYYSIEGGWGNGDVNVTLGLYNIFSRSWKGDVMTLESPVYRGYFTGISDKYRQKINLTLTYTVSYGKKIQNRDNLDGNVSGAGSVVEK